MTRRLPCNLTNVSFWKEFRACSSNAVCWKWHLADEHIETVLKFQCKIGYEACYYGLVFLYGRLTESKGNWKPFLLCALGVTTDKQISGNAYVEEEKTIRCLGFLGLVSGGFPPQMLFSVCLRLHAFCTI